MRKSGDNLSRAWLTLPAGGAALALGAVLLWRAGGSVDNRLSAATAAGPAETGPAAIERGEEKSLDLSEIRLPLTDIRPERGLCFIARIPLLSPNERDDRKPGLRLFEDDVELKQAARPHAEIRELGGGRFSHWGRQFFSLPRMAAIPGRTGEDTRSGSRGTQLPISGAGGLHRWPSSPPMRSGREWDTSTSTACRRSFWAGPPIWKR